MNAIETITLTQPVMQDVQAKLVLPVDKPFEHTLGPHSAKMLVCGEAWGEHEDMWKVPLVWWSGIELARMMSEAQLTSKFYLDRTSPFEPQMMNYWNSSEFLFTNVFAERPEKNQLDAFCISKAELPEKYSEPYFRPGKYFRPEYLHHVDRLYQEIELTKPNLVLCLGNAACWALLGVTNISSIRGSIAWSERAKVKVLPTFHPAYVLRSWQDRPIVVADLIKAKRELEFPEIVRPERRVLVNPTMVEIREWMTRPATHYAVDIETKNKQITMVGFARSKNDALVIPFIRDFNKNYWPTHNEEVEAWGCVRALLESDKIKIFQNGLYDLSYLVSMGFKPKNCLEDTMLLHHSLYPELRKGLGFLGSIYTNEASWKLMRNRKKEMNKREE